MVFDITSSSVAAALIQSGSESPEVLWSLRRDFPFQNRLELSRLTKDMLVALQAVAEAAVAANERLFGAQKLDDIFVVFSSPWYVSQTTLLSFAHQKSVSVDGALSDIEGYLNEKERTLNAAKGATAMLMEKKIIQTRLNGYPTGNPRGKKAKSVEAAVLVSFLDTEVYRQTSEVFKRLFHRGTRTYHSSMLVLFSGIRDLFAEEEDFLLASVSGEATELALVRDDVLIEHGSFPVGKNTLLRAIASSLKTTKDDAESRLELYRSGKSEAKESERMSIALAAVQSDWESAFEGAVQKLSNGHTLPTSLFLVTELVLGEWFRAALLENSTNALTMTGAPFSVVLLTPEHFSSHLSLGKSVLLDPYLALYALFAHKYPRTDFADTLV